MNGEPLYLRIARLAIQRDSEAELGLVVGATRPEALRLVRALSQDCVLLVPGVGAQGADAGEAFRLASNEKGENALITASRSVMYASSGRDFSVAAGRAAERAASALRR